LQPQTIVWVANSWKPWMEPLKSLLMAISWPSVSWTKIIILKYIFIFLIVRLGKIL
jgi:hypothetical protein